MKTLIIINPYMKSFAESALASTPSRIIDACLEDPASALRQYGGKEMEFHGAVVSCARAYGSEIGLWAVRVNAGDIDVIGYLRNIVPVDLEIVMRGTCIDLRNEAKITVVLHPATVR